MKEHQFRALMAALKMLAMQQAAALRFLYRADARAYYAAHPEYDLAEDNDKALAAFPDADEGLTGLEHRAAFAAAGVEEALAALGLSVDGAEYADVSWVDVARWDVDQHLAEAEADSGRTAPGPSSPGE